jgi:hypothetical protein
VRDSHCADIREFQRIDSLPLKIEDFHSIRGILQVVGYDFGIATLSLLQHILRVFRDDLKPIFLSRRIQINSNNLFARSFEISDEVESGACVVDVGETTYPL